MFFLKNTVLQIIIHNYKRKHLKQKLFVFCLFDWILRNSVVKPFRGAAHTL